MIEKAFNFICYIVITAFVVIIPYSCTSGIINFIGK